MGVLLFYLFLAIFFSFLCSILEAVLLSITPTFLNVAVSEKRSYANTLQQLKEDVDKPLIAILTLNTLAHTVGAMGVGAQAEIVFGEANFALLGLEIPLTSIIAAVMTLLILVLSEIIPKTIGATYWKGLTGFSTHTLNIMVNILKYTGMLWLLQLFTKIVGKGGAGHGSVLSRNDLSVMAEMGAKEGTIEKHESTIIQNLLHFSEIRVKDIMTPRTVVIAFSAERTIGDFFQEHKNIRFSRIPIFDKTIDHVSGYVLKDDILLKMVEQKGQEQLKNITRQLQMVNEDLPMPELFDTLMAQREHIALVVDSYGGMAGIVTMEDVLETLLGMEIMDELDNVQDMQVLARRKWEERAKKLGLIQVDISDGEKEQ
ncbi:MAG: CNNM domain-containing protein [Chitinophagales bacterium]